MKNSLRTISAFFASLVLFSSSTFAGVEEVQEKLSEKMSHLDINSVSESPIAGLYEVVFSGQRVFYVTEDVDYVFDGSVMELATGRNLTQSRSNELQQARYLSMGKKWVKTLRDFGADRYLSYPGNAEGELAGRNMYVFTDITCPYCSRFHEGVEAFVEAGVTVNYVLFARAGLGSKPHKDHISIWCSDDPQQALTDGKARKPVKPMSCEDHPVDDHMQLTKDVEVNATPTAILDSGVRVDGFRPVESVLATLREKPALPEE